MKIFFSYYTVMYMYLEALESPETYRCNDIKYIIVR